MGASRKISKIIVHCSDTPTGRDIRANDIEKWHEERREWGPGFTSGKYIGYHWVICVDGVIEMGRPSFEAGVHCKGHNSDSIGICVVGRGVYNSDQTHSLYYILDEMCRMFGLEAKHVFGHCEFNELKECPMMNMDIVRDNLEMMLNKKENAWNT